MRQVGTAPRVTRHMTEVQEAGKDTPAFPNALQSPQELPRTQEPGSLVGFQGHLPVFPAAAPPSSSVNVSSDSSEGRPQPVVDEKRDRLMSRARWWRLHCPRV